MAYIDGFLIALPKKNLKKYAMMASLGKRSWMKHGALDYQEAVGEDMAVHPGCGKGFPHLLKLKKGEVAVFSYILFKSRKHRDRVNAKVFKDMKMPGELKRMPFDMRRMHTGGFEVIVGS